MCAGSRSSAISLLEAGKFGVILQPFPNYLAAMVLWRVQLVIEIVLFEELLVLNPIFLDCPIEYFLFHVMLPF
jgi:hypothetical protein